VKPVMLDTLLVGCPSCGTTNRVSREKIEAGLAPMCARCKHSLQVQLKPVIVTDSTFASLVEDSQIPVLLDLWAPWCGPCRIVGPVIDELVQELVGRVRIGKLNVDDNPAITERFGVSSIPTLLVFKAGREVDRIVGVQPKAEITRRLEQVTA